MPATILAVCKVEQTSERCCNSALRPGFVFVALVVLGGDLLPIAKFVLFCLTYKLYVDFPLYLYGILSVCVCACMRVCACMLVCVHVYVRACTS